jgi:hypothetical protein
VVGFAVERSPLISCLSITALFMRKFAIYHQTTFWNILCSGSVVDLNFKRPHHEGIVLILLSLKVIGTKL